MAVFEENPDQITKADIIVGIPSYNEGEAIGNTTVQVAKGLKEYFGELSSVIINCDNHSADGTKDAFFSAPSEVPKIYISTPPDVRGKGQNLKNLFEKTRELQAKAVVVIEADIKNVAPYWVKNLGEPLLKGAGYTSPLYVRHKYEATLTNSIIYPLTRCLYGRRVRQPNAGDFGFKGELVDAFLDSSHWTDSVQQFGVDIWATTVALNSRVPIVLSILGCPKVHRTKDPYAHLSVTFHQIVGTIFDLMKVYEKFWTRVKWSKPCGLYGTDMQDVESPIPVEVNTARLHERFLQGFDKHHTAWESIYDQTVHHKLQEIRGLGLQHFSIPAQTWAKILFDSAVAYQSMNADQRRNLLDALLPIYIGKVLSFVKKTERMSVQQAEEYVENECTVFEENKPYLMSKWQ